MMAHSSLRHHFENAAPDTELKAASFAEFDAASSNYRFRGTPFARYTKRLIYASIIYRNFVEQVLEHVHIYIGTD